MGESKFRMLKYFFELTGVDKAILKDEEMKVQLATIQKYINSDDYRSHKDPYYEAESILIDMIRYRGEKKSHAYTKALGFLRKANIDKDGLKELIKKYEIEKRI